MKKTKTIIHEFRKSRCNAWLRAHSRKMKRPLENVLRLDGVDFKGVLLAIVFILCLLVASCSSHHYFSINAEEITNPSILYSDSTSLTNPF